tara:strand:+ start:465 stop:728 length:264 start_codon:yes stop_codon:yes gene_type:complete
VVKNLEGLYAKGGSLGVTPVLRVTENLWMARDLDNYVLRWLILFFSFAWMQRRAKITVISGIFCCAEPRSSFSLHALFRNASGRNSG